MQEITPEFLAQNNYHFTNEDEKYQCVNVIFCPECKIVLNRYMNIERIYANVVEQKIYFCNHKFKKHKLFRKTMVICKKCNVDGHGHLLRKNNSSYNFLETDKKSTYRCPKCYKLFIN